MNLVLDPCCGSRMMWFDKADPRAIFGDQRSETITVTDRSHREDGTRTARAAIAICTGLALVWIYGA